MLMGCQRQRVSPVLSPGRLCVSEKGATTERSYSPKQTFPEDRSSLCLPFMSLFRCASGLREVEMVEKWTQIGVGEGIR